MDGKGDVGAYRRACIKRDTVYQKGYSDTGQQRVVCKIYMVWSMGEEGGKEGF